MKIEGFDGKFGGGGTAPDAAVSGVARHPAAPAASRPVSTRPGGAARPTSSFGIKSALSEVAVNRPQSKAVAETAAHEKINAREPIDAGKVQAALRQYVAEHSPEPMVALALETHHPVVEGEQITIFADNQLQIDKLDAMRMHLHHTLMKTLRNGHLSLQFRLFDTGATTETRKLFTASEKYAHFVELNPVIADLKNIFGLELD